VEEEAVVGSLSLCYNNDLQINGIALLLINRQAIFWVGNLQKRYSKVRDYFYVGITITSLCPDKKLMIPFLQDKNQ
jgi:hypothetical protein